MGSTFCLARLFHLLVCSGSSNRHVMLVPGPMVAPIYHRIYRRRPLHLQSVYDNRHTMSYLSLWPVVLYLLLLLVSSLLSMMVMMMLLLLFTFCSFFLCVINKIKFVNLEKCVHSSCLTILTYAPTHIYLLLLIFLFIANCITYRKLSSNFQEKTKTTYTN